MFLLTPIKAWFTTQYKVSNYWVHMTSTACSPYLHKDDCVPLTSSVQSLSRVPLFATPWSAARQASLSITNSRSSLRLTSIESVMPSSHLILCRPLLLLPSTLPSSQSFPMSQLFAWGVQSTGVSALASFFPTSYQGNNFNEPWLSHLPIHRKALNSLRCFLLGLRPNISKSTDVK